MRLERFVILGVTLIGFALRLYYLTTTHPFFDEYTTVLAARQILRYGWPLLPSGLFYEHGLLATYLITPFTALFINTPVASWQPAQWGLMLSRWPSLLVSTLTIPAIYAIGQRCFSPLFSNLASSVALLAAGLFALSPEGIVWGGRARMYALATLLVLLAVYWAYRGAVHPAPAKYRRLALLALLAALLTQFGVLILIPPLVVSMVMVGWLSYSKVAGVQDRRVARSQDRKVAEEQRGRGAGAQPFQKTSHGRRGADRPALHVLRFTFYVSRLTPHASLFTYHASRPWFLQPAILVEGTVLALIIGLAILVKRLGRPLGAEAVAGFRAGSNFWLELYHKTIAYQTRLDFTWTGMTDFLARQFGVPHHFWLTLAALSAAGLTLFFWLIKNRLSSRPSPNLPVSQSLNLPISLFLLFLALTFGLIILEMITLLDPARRNPRYLVMYLPLFYLIVAAVLLNFTFYVLRFMFYVLRPTLPASRHTPTFTTVALLILFTLLGFDDLQVALITPEPAYEAAFAKVRAEWQPGDVLLTMNTPAAELYLGGAAGFTVQVEAAQFLLNQARRPVDRWLGVPWIGSATEFNAALNRGSRAWFVIDTIRRPVYFRGDWLAVVNHQMEPIWSHDEALIYRTRPDRTPLATQPDHLVKAALGDAIQLVGYTLRRSPPAESFISQSPNLPPSLSLTLFWQALTPPSADYTVFVHLRNETGATVAQQDSRPLDGLYPTHHWQAGETIIDPITLALPEEISPGTYTLVAGLYRLDTLERLPVAGDRSGENAVILGEVTLE